MPVYENSRIRVTVSNEISARFDNSRALILSQAMVILGNRSEAGLLEAEMAVITPEEIRADTATTTSERY